MSSQALAVYHAVDRSFDLLAPSNGVLEPHHQILDVSKS
jgi:hypothetical protein